MKKLSALILALTLCLSLCACGNNEAPQSTTEPETTVSSESVDSTLNSEAEATTEASAVTTQQQTEKPTQGTTVHTHNWSRADCQTPKTCRTCGATEGGTGDHSFAKATCTNPAKCTVCGQTSGDALGCTAGSDNNCIRCGRVMLTLANALSAPIDSMDELNTFCHGYYTQYCYLGGNFRLIFNTADGIIFSWGARNISDKTIESITYTIEYYDRAASPAADDITGSTSYTGRILGPIAPGKAFYSRYLIGYGKDVHYGRVTDVTLEFSDGTTVSGNYGYTTWHNIRSEPENIPNECLIIQK